MSCDDDDSDMVIIMILVLRYDLAFLEEFHLSLHLLSVRMLLCHISKLK